MNIEDKLTDAFGDSAFQKELQDNRIKIETDLSKFIKHLNDEKIVDLKVFENLESRVKSQVSFSEKIRRKDYVHSWNVPEIQSEIQNLIAKELPDLIGFRINCLFYDDEKIIYDDLKNYYDDDKFGENYYLNFEENKTQKNGHIIYKVSGCYNHSFNFEIQIKCSVHNIWGEVEHSRIYKNEDYDPKLLSKKNITEEVFSILKSSDRQLLEIFNEKYTKDDLIRSLFYQYTNEDVRLKKQTAVLSKHYQHFFEIFKKVNDLDLIKQFVASKLSNSAFEKRKLDYIKSEKMTAAHFIERYIEFDISVVSEIASFIYDPISETTLIEYLISDVESLLINPLEAEENSDIDGDSDVFNDDTDNDQNIQDYVFATYDDFFEKR